MITLLEEVASRLRLQDNGKKKKKKRWLPPVCLNVILLQNNKTRGETVKKRGQLLEGFLPEIQNSSSPLITLIHYKSFPALLVPR